MKTLQFIQTVPSGGFSRACNRAPAVGGGNVWLRRRAMFGLTGVRPPATGDTGQRDRIGTGEDPGMHGELDKIDTPAVLVDMDIAERNIAAYQAYCDSHGIGLRPHIKTHKLPSLAQHQIATGAIGITCQKISEAEAMLSEGPIDDILLTYNILGSGKLSRLTGLATRTNLTVVADNAAVVRGLSDAFADRPPLRVLVECDTGAGRCGVQTAQAARDLARMIDDSAGLIFHGLMTYPPADAETAVDEWLHDARTLIEAEGIAVPVVSGGGTPGMWRAHQVPTATEHRAGTYVYNDRSLVTRGTCGWEDCALSVLVTVVSVPTSGRAVIDAGSKVLTADLSGLQGYGHVLGRPDIRIAKLSEEHGVLHADAIDLGVGQKLRIVPNHACVVSNMVDQVTQIRGERVIGETKVVARGTVR